MMPVRACVMVVTAGTLVSQCDRLKNVLKSVDRFYYSIKANWNPTLINLIVSQGLGLECVSIDELQHVSALFKSMSCGGDCINIRQNTTSHFLSKFRWKGRVQVRLQHEVNCTL